MKRQFVPASEVRLRVVRGGQAMVEEWGSVTGVVASLSTLTTCNSHGRDNTRATAVPLVTLQAEE